ncbi:PH domain-containing protein [Plantactinospora sp. KBS50]|uniref:PH domain-containing protein n=1 Tax=Plantactinospora sp. KBS50 TaxID=2024580 RepID=UPI0012FE1081|nr:PH domain-containing protein [Plantactinospora sp. KBS50]
MLAIFRPTWRQIVAHALVAGSVTLAGVLLLGVLFTLARQRSAVGPRMPVDPAVAAGLAGALVPLAALGSGLVRWRTGACINSAGLRAGGPLGRTTFVPWERVTDVRAERRRRHTVVMVYGTDGVTRRLPAPYDGDLLAGDARFERKLFLVQHLWETHRSWGVPG